MRNALFVLVLITGIALMGCANDSNSPADSGVTSELIVSPADGATGVRLDATVKLTFATAMNRELIERGFHVISESSLVDSLCPDSTMTHTSMMNCMDDSLMTHMDLYHSTPGQFSWNEAGTVCTFRPDAMMSPSTRYMMHMDKEMMDEMRAHAGGGGMMESHETGMMGGAMTLHFSTMALSGGHEGHH